MQQHRVLVGQKEKQEEKNRANERNYAVEKKRSEVQSAKKITTEEREPRELLLNGRE